MRILCEIKTLAVEDFIKTGIEPTRVYLGRKELHKVAEWFGSSTIVYGEGAARPELWGMKVYAVNDEQHMCCA